MEDTLEGLAHSNPEVRSQALFQRNLVGGPIPPDLLAKLLKDPDPTVRDYAITALEWAQPTPELVAFCFALVHDGEIPRSAFSLLRKLRPGAFGPGVDLVFGLNDLSDANLELIASLKPLILVNEGERWEPEAGWRPGDERHFRNEIDLRKDLRDSARSELERRAKR